MRFSLSDNTKTAYLADDFCELLRRSCQLFYAIGGIYYVIKYFIDFACRYVSRMDLQ